MKITNQMVKDYKELVFDNYYNLFKYSINFYKDCLEKIDGMQFDDFSKGVKSASLVKRDELEKLNKKLKNAFDFDDDFW